MKYFEQIFSREFNANERKTQKMCQLGTKITVHRQKKRNERPILKCKKNQNITKDLENHRASTYERKYRKCDALITIKRE